MLVLHPVVRAMRTPQEIILTDPGSVLYCSGVRSILTTCKGFKLSKNPFSDIQALKRQKASRVSVNIRLPLKVVAWVKETSKRHRVPLEAVYASLLIAGIAQFEKDKPLERVS